MDTRIRSLNIAESEAGALASVCQQLIETYGATLVSLVAYGSSVTGGYEPGISDINLVLVLERGGFREISKAAPILRRSKLRLSPQFFDLASVESLAEVYPMELRDMQIAHVVLHGRDLLSDLYVDEQRLRAECRRALTGVATRIRHQAVAVGDDPRALSALTNDTLRAILAVLRHLLRLEGKQIPPQKKDLIRMAGRDYGFDCEPFVRALGLRSEPGSDNQMKKAFEDYFDSLQSLAALIRSRLT
jgi:hypothetical protein